MHKDISAWDFKIMKLYRTLKTNSKQLLKWALSMILKDMVILVMKIKNILMVRGNR